jgi:hypothetical protein
MGSDEEQSKISSRITFNNSDGAGIISSIIGIAGAGFRLSLILNAVSCEVASEGLEVHSISKAVTLFSLTLKQVGISLQNADSVHTYEALDGVNRIAQDATEVFDEFNDMLDRVRAKPQEGKPAPTIQQRFQWCFKRHRVSYLMGHLETLKMNASLIQQVLALGRLMASTNKADSTEEVQMKQELIRQERAETQNVLIVRYWQMSKMDRLFEASRLEDEDHKIASIEQHDDDLALVSSNGDAVSRQLAIEAPPPEYSSSLALVKLPAYSLGELDQTLHQIKRSPKDMVHVSQEAIDPLLDRWTRWYEVREQRHKREAREVREARDSKAQSRYVPTVDNLQEDDDDGMHPYHRRYDSSKDAQSRGYFLEGSTTDWRQPHSAEARSTFSRRKREYKRFQPSVSADASDDDVQSRDPNSPRSERIRDQPRRKAPTHHVIDSSSESDVSSSDHAPAPRARRERRPSDSPRMDRAHPVLQHAYTANTSPRSSQAGSINGAPRPHPNHVYSAPNNPYPPINTANAHNPYGPPMQPQHYPAAGPAGYQPTAPQQPGTTPQQYPGYPQLSSAHARYHPATATLPQNGNRMSVPAVTTPYGSLSGPGGRPVSRDGPPRSPSRSNYGSTTGSQPGGPPGPGSRSGSYRGGDSYHYHAQQRPWSPGAGGHGRVDEQGRPIREEVKEKEKSNAKKNLREGAAKGLLGAGAIGGFLEMLEGLSI